jgi:hypothetical protein
LAGLRNTTALVCTRASIAGVDHPPIKNLTKHYCFRFVNVKTVMQAMFSGEKEGKLVVFAHGRMMQAEKANKSAQARKKSKK